MYSIFTSDFMGIPVDTANWVANVIIALLVIFLLYLAFRVFTRPRMAGGRRSRNARLAITDAASIDDRRRLVLVRRDDVEHLIMIGGATDLVIEGDIKKETQARVAPSEPAASMPPPIPVRPAPAAPTPPTPVKPSAPAAAAKPATAASASPTPANIPTIQAKPATSTPPQTTSPATQSDASSLIGDVRSKPVDKADTPKATVGQNMDALLTEITAKK